jgi:hypothetical protein
MGSARRVVLHATLCATFGLLCSIPAVAKKESGRDVLPMRVVQAVTCKSVRDAGELLEPVDVGKTFLTADKQVTSFVRFQHVLKPHKIQWRWYDPEGKLYTQSSELPVTLRGKYHEFFTGAHSILIQGEKATLLPGQWKVVVVLDGVIAASMEFTLSSREVAP